MKVPIFELLEKCGGFYEVGLVNLRLFYAIPMALFLDFLLRSSLDK